MPDGSSARFTGNIGTLRDRAVSDCDFDGNLWLTFHQPNGNPNERPKFLQLAEEKRLHTA